MKHLRLFENFKGIDSICRQYGIENYTVNPDGTVDVDDNVHLDNKELKKLPLKFGKVTGNFNCVRNQLTTLEGAPREVGGDFYCRSNQLTTLEGAPREVGGGFFCFYNQLTTLEGGPREVVGRFDCEYNPIWEVYKLFPDYKSFVDSLDYGYLRGTNISRSRFKEALDELNIKMPKSIDGYKYID